FFFQAEGGIRVFHVTGVQTCALPISQKTKAEPRERTEGEERKRKRGRGREPTRQLRTERTPVRPLPLRLLPPPSFFCPPCLLPRSEERRVGRECRCRATPGPVDTRAR